MTLVHLGVASCFRFPWSFIKQVEPVYASHTINAAAGRFSQAARSFLINARKQRCLLAGNFIASSAGAIGLTERKLVESNAIYIARQVIPTRRFYGPRCELRNRSVERSVFGNIVLANYAAHAGFHRQSVLIRSEGRRGNWHEFMKWNYIFSKSNE